MICCIYICYIHLLNKVKKYLNHIKIVYLKSIWFLKHSKILECFIVIIRTFVLRLALPDTPDRTGDKRCYKPLFYHWTISGSFYICCLDFYFFLRKKYKNLSNLKFAVSKHLRQATYPSLKANMLHTLYILNISLDGVFYFYTSFYVVSYT